jgi:hypothetical protein
MTTAAVTESPSAHLAADEAHLPTVLATLTALRAEPALIAKEPSMAGKAREVAHAALAVVGALAFAQAFVVDGLATYAGVAAHLPLGVVNGIGLAGGILVGASKFIDSANNALTRFK